MISADFLKLMEDIPVGKALIEKTGISAFKMLNRFKLNLPTESDSTAWIVEGDTKFSDHFYDITLFLKHAWLYSEREENEHIHNLKRAVADEITSFEKDLLIQEEQKKLNELIKLLNLREEETKSIQNELKLKQQKEAETSLRNSESASKPRGCKEVSEFFDKLVINNPDKKRTKDLWSLIPGERDGSEFYRENNKIHHEECKCRPIGKGAFYGRIKKIKENLGKVLDIDAK
jgi:hypothetical protein